MVEGRLARAGKDAIGAELPASHANRVDLQTSTQGCMFVWFIAL